MEGGRDVGREGGREEGREGEQQTIHMIGPGPLSIGLQSNTQARTAGSVSRAHDTRGGVT